MSDSILLLAHGTPDSPGEVAEYLRNVTGGRPLPQEVITEISHRYALIGRSPLTDITRAQTAALAKLVDRPVYFGMRNWHPFIKDVVAQMLADGITRTTALCLAPQNSRTSVGLYRKALMDAAGGKLQINFIDSWHDHPLLVRAFAAKLTPVIAEAEKNHTGQVEILFTAHSVPERTVAPQADGKPGDPYAEQCKMTAALIATEAGLNEKDWSFAFQSQGMSGGPWLGPTVEDTLTRMAASGAQAVVLQTIGFVCDHVEVLYDIDIAFKQFASGKNPKLYRSDSLNDSPEFISALAAVVNSDHG